MAVFFISFGCAFVSAIFIGIWNERKPVMGDPSADFVSYTMIQGSLWFLAVFVQSIVWLQWLAS